jgi:hypothetical protein
MTESVGTTAKNSASHTRLRPFPAIFVFLGESRSPQEGSRQNCVYDEEE